MSPLRAVYLALAVWGAVHPLYWFARHLGDGGGIGTMIDAWTANAATRFLTWDLIITGVALSIWIIAETRVRRNWQALWALPATFCIGVSCGLPLYLFLRTRRV